MRCPAASASTTKSANQLVASAASVRQKNTDVPSGAATARQIGLAGTVPARDGRREQRLGPGRRTGPGRRSPRAIAHTAASPRGHSSRPGRARFSSIRASPCATSAPAWSGAGRPARSPCPRSSDWAASSASGSTVISTNEYPASSAGGGPAHGRRRELRCGRVSRRATPPARSASAARRSRSGRRRPGGTRR